MANNVRFSILAVDKTRQAFMSVKRGLGDMGKSINSTFSRLTNMKGLIGAAFGGAAFKTIADAADHIHDLSVRLGLSTEALSQFQHVAAMTGVEFDTLAKGLQLMMRNVSSAAQGTSTATNALSELGLSAQALKSLRPEQQFEIIADAMNGVSNESDKVRLAMAIFGRSGAEMIQVMDGGAESIRNMRLEADKMGLTLSQEGARAIADMNDAFDRFGEAVKGVATQMVALLAPAIEMIVNFLTDALVGAVNLTKTAFQGMIVFFKKVYQYIVDAIGWLMEQIAKLPGLLVKTLDAASDVPLIGDSFRNAADSVWQVQSSLQGMANSLHAHVDGLRDLSFTTQQATESQKALSKEMVAMKKPDMGGFKQAIQQTNEPLAELQTNATNVFDMISGRAKETAGNLIDSFADATFGIGDGFGGLKEQLSNSFKQLNADILKNTMRNFLLGDNNPLFGNTAPIPVMKPAMAGGGDPAIGFANTFAETAGPQMATLFGDHSGGFLQDIQDIFGNGSSSGFLGSLGEIFKTATSSFGGIFSSLGSSLSGILGGMGGGLSSLFSGFGGGFGSLISAGMSMFGGFFADGGRIHPGKAHVVGERGRELFVPDSAGTIIPNESLGGKNVTVNMHVTTPDVQGFRQSQGQMVAEMARQIQRARRNL